MKQTDKFSFNLFEGKDNFDYEVINENFKKIDKDILSTQEEVEEFLKKHPEYMTTVKDKSLTAEKFTDDLALRTLKDYVTPQMFGAKGDGVTDDTEAIQNAVNNGKVILFPSGVYNVTNTIFIPSERKIVGEQSTISCNVSNVEAIFATEKNSTMISFENIHITGNMGVMGKGKATTIGIYFLENSHYITIKDVTLQDHNYAVKEESFIYLFSLMNVRALTCNNAFVFKGGAKTTFTLIGCEAECCGNAYVFYNLTYANLMSCGADYCNYPENNPYGPDRGYGSFESGNGVYHFHNCRGVTVSGCGTEHCYGLGAIYANASDLVVNNFKCCDVKSQFKHNFTAYPNAATGIITTGTERSNLTINNIMDEGFTDEYTPTVYPSRSVPLIGYNYIETVYGASDKYHIVVNSLCNRTLCAGQAGSKYCICINDLGAKVTTKTLSLTAYRQYGAKTFTGKSCTKIILPFISNSNRWISHKLNLTMLERNFISQTQKAFDCSFVISSLTSCSGLNVLSKTHDDATININGLNVEITLPFSVSEMLLYIDYYGNETYFNYDGITFE